MAGTRARRGSAAAPAERAASLPAGSRKSSSEPKLAGGGAWGLPDFSFLGTGSYSPAVISDMDFAAVRAFVRLQDAKRIPTAEVANAIFRQPPGVKLHFAEALRDEKNVGHGGGVLGSRNFNFIRQR